tara:strand:- start:7 stop:291 length:285 start_codon:yes stop_codon:yes gene_type:complete
MKLGTLSFSELLEISDDIYKNTIISAKRARQIIQKRFDEAQAEQELFDEEYTPLMVEEIDNYVELDKAITISVQELLNNDLEWDKKDSDDGLSE